MSAPAAVWVAVVQEPEKGRGADHPSVIIFDTEDGAKGFVAQWIESNWDTDILGERPDNAGDMFDMFDDGPGFDDGLRAEGWGHWVFKAPVQS